MAEILNFDQDAPKRWRSVQGAQMAQALVLDTSGKTLSVGSRVKVVSLAHADFGHLSDSEFSELAGQFVGQIFEVDEIDQYGQAWVTHSKRVASNRLEVENIALSASEMELQEI